MIMITFMTMIKVFIVVIIYYFWKMSVVSSSFPNLNFISSSMPLSRLKITSMRIAQSALESRYFE